MLAGQCGDGGSVAGSGRGRGIKFPPCRPLVCKITTQAARCWCSPLRSPVRLHALHGGRLQKFMLGITCISRQMRWKRADIGSCLLEGCLVCSCCRCCMARAAGTDGGSVARSKGLFTAHELNESTQLVPNSTTRTRTGPDRTRPDKVRGHVGDTGLRHGSPTKSGWARLVEFGHYTTHSLITRVSVSRLYSVVGRPIELAAAKLCSVTVLNASHIPMRRSHRSSRTSFRELYFISVQFLFMCCKQALSEFSARAADPGHDRKVWSLKERSHGS